MKPIHPNDLEDYSKQLKKVGQKLRALSGMLQAAHHDEPEIDEQFDAIRVGLGIIIDESADIITMVADELGELPYEHTTKETKS
ncbi:MAG: hypothetical protein JST16_11705 [Bdellovibrionales bacterium]|nr:hypothetical protein [Bdellovibrionales bacterium]